MVAETLAHERAGSGRPVVFLHGITANRAHWRPVVDRLVDRFDCINVDLAGHGGSAGRQDVDLFGQVAAVAELVEELDLQRPVLAGHSYGGMVATFAATALPVAGVVNVDQGFDMRAMRSTIEPLADRLRGGDFDAAFAEFVASQRPDLVPADRQQLTMENIQPRQDVVLGVWSTVFDTPPAELAAQIESVLPSVTVPYLAILGDEPGEEERRLQSLVGRGTVEVWPGHGHFVHLVDPDRVAQRIARFIESAA